MSISRTQKWVVKRRYRHFLALDKQLRKISPAATLPPLPQKQFIRSFSASYIDGKMKALDAYLQGVLLIPELASS